MPASSHANFSAYDSRRANPIYHFTHGLRFFFAGAGLLVRHPSLLGLSIVPILLTFALLGSIAFGCAWWAGLLFDRGASPLGGDWRFFAQALVFILALLLGYLLYLPLARVLLAPFSEALSRRTLAILRGRGTGPPGLGWGRAMLEGAKLVAFQLTITAFVFALSLLVPPAAPVGILIAVFFCGLDYLDVPLSTRGLSFGRKLALMWRNKSLALGFGLAGYALLIIPLVNLFSLPVGVIGATLLTNSLDRDEA